MTNSAESTSAEVTAAPASEIARFYHPELDGLRFVAFLLVFVHHVTPMSLDPSWPAFVRRAWELFRESGALGVDLFFCLSAYLITVLLLVERERSGGIDLRRFWLRRLLRIWPLYFVFIGGAMLLPYLGTNQKPFGPHTIPFLLFVGNWSCGLIGFPANVAIPLWSVSVEEQFYLLWPPVLRRASPRLLAFFPWLLIAISILARLVIVALGWEHPAMWCLTLTRLDCLAVGILIAVRVRDRPKQRSGTARVVLFFGGFALLELGMYLFPVTLAQTWGLATFGYPMFAVGAGLMLLGVLARPGTQPGPLGRPTLVYLGKISYGLYVFHQLASAVAYRVLPDDAPWVATFVALGLTVTLAATSYAILERPFLMMKDRYATVPSRPV